MAVSMPTVHKPTILTVLVIVVVMFVAYHFLFKKGR